ncbi:hypothetical protein BU15DRAFT_66514 [Melanogaster broomeanus]|nr:hypothetical protein BU15DRAFT_66514 [Melanogaster broomeanus]
MSGWRLWHAQLPVRRLHLLTGMLRANSALYWTRFLAHSCLPTGAQFYPIISDVVSMTRIMYQLTWFTMHLVFWLAYLVLRHSHTLSSLRVYSSCEHSDLNFQAHHFPYQPVHYSSTQDQVAFNPQQTIPLLKVFLHIAPQLIPASSLPHELFNIAEPREELSPNKCIALDSTALCFQ